MGSLIVIFNWIGLVCFLWWICNFIYLLFLNGLSNTSFSIFDVIFIIISVIIATLFGLNGSARGRLTPLVDGVLSFVFYCCVFRYFTIFFRFQWYFVNSTGLKKS